MKLNQLILTAFFIFTFNNMKAQSQLETHRDSLLFQIDEYYKLNLIVFQENSTQEEIDDIFELFTDDFTYVHPNYGGVYTREVLYNGYLRNQKNGGYDGSVIDIKVENKIIGHNAVAVSKRFVTKEKGQIVEGEAQMTLFEFRDGKICRIYEYW